MSIITKKGDDGFTDRLFGGKIRKDCMLVGVIGDIDELNAWIGLALKKTPYGVSYIRTETDDMILGIQKNLVSIMGELSSTDKERYVREYRVVNEDNIVDLEKFIYREEKSCKFDDWQNPSNEWDVACRVCRRAERNLWTYHFNLMKWPIMLEKEWATKEQPIRKEVLIYLNRLSDYLWLLGRVYK